MKIKRVVYAISGGVDSAASAFLLKSRGYEVIGVFMKNWDLTDEKGQCTLAEDAEDAYNVCKKLSIPFKEVSFVKEYWNDVFLNFIKEYQACWTPNSDVLCSKRIKFKAFFEHCQDKIGFDAVAIGHYAKTSFGEELETFDASKGVRLLKSFDQLKDQTFFLSQIPQDALQFTMFPVGGMTKNIVKEIANSAGLSKISQKKESTGICFVGKRHFQDFIAHYILPNPGPFVHIETKEVMAQHQGIHNWTTGQRCLIGREKVRHFVAEKDPTTNSIFVAPGTDHPSLYRSIFFTDRPHWIHSWPRPTRALTPGQNTDGNEKSDPDEDCTLKASEDLKYYLKEQYQRHLSKLVPLPWQAEFTLRLDILYTTLQLNSSDQSSIAALEELFMSTEKTFTIRINGDNTSHSIVRALSQSLRSLSPTSSLSTLIFHIDLETRELDILCQALNFCCHITKLHLSKLSFGPAGYESFSRVVKYGKLESLKLSLNLFKTLPICDNEVDYGSPEDLRRLLPRLAETASKIASFTDPEASLYEPNTHTVTSISEKQVSCGSAMFLEQVELTTPACSPSQHKSGFHYLLSSLTTSTCLLKHLDLSNCYLTKMDLNCLGEGIVLTVSLEKLTLVGLESFDQVTPILQGLSATKTVSDVDLSSKKFQLTT
ncbi:tRNA-specific 2-thiouridylase MnmA-like isoform X4 [Artemia franciscana]|uniref:tRNA-specific 2-thiouridylase MnmA-like isoform X4 n=1 Tax=Artemia franciscana TaxID=6661 RepID=UPI0032DAEC55